ncbi:ibr domain containing protein [Stylonychia lemnae]|uniref:RBR-type E3 ubiquitin transferase n=1 Tax=Stylonychia lemnae TaxID=5949 RepID=A0A078AS36_STYLE|nr:ibr domain containing protein [Stylonychia lemnae]|eukprot:CDW84022.1 ibr domain containing protein [Stylonychia lemnae]
MSEKVRAHLYQYLVTIASSKSKLDYEDCFVLGLIMAKFNKNAETLNELVIQMHEQKKKLRGTFVKEDQKFEYRLNVYLQNTQQDKISHNSSQSSETYQLQSKKRKLNELNENQSKPEQHDQYINLPIKPLINLPFQNKAMQLKVSDADIVIEEEDDDDVPNFGINANHNGTGDSYSQDNGNNKYKFRGHYGNNQHNRNSNNNGGGASGLGFISDSDNLEKISDLNRAIESLDNTQFRNSIKAGSGNSDQNELSQELPVNKYNHHQPSSFTPEKAKRYENDIRMRDGVNDHDIEFEDEDDEVLEDQDILDAHIKSEELKLSKEFTFNQDRLTSQQQHNQQPQGSKDADKKIIVKQQQNQLLDMSYADEEDEFLDLLNEEKFFENKMAEQEKRDQELARIGTSSQDSETQRLIKQLQKEDDEAKRNERQNIDQEDNNLTCAVCLDDIVDDNILPLTSCDHFYHKECLESYFRVEIQDRRFPIKCPQDNCGKEIEIMDIQDVLAEDDLKKFDEYNFSKIVDQQEDLSWCPTPDCGYAFFFEEGNYEHDCPKCGISYCLNCRVVFHKKLTCEKYQTQTKNKDQERLNEEKFMQFVKGAKFKQCPKCKFWVEKNDGCDHMTCRCKKQFCYKCGGNYPKCECYVKQMELNRKRQELLEKRRQAAARRKKESKSKTKPNNRGRSRGGRR